MTQITQTRKLFLNAQYLGMRNIHVGVILFILHSVIPQLSWVMGYARLNYPLALKNIHRRFRPCLQKWRKRLSRRAEHHSYRIFLVICISRLSSFYLCTYYTIFVIPESYLMFGAEVAFNMFVRERVLVIIVYHHITPPWKPLPTPIVRRGSETFRIHTLIGARYGVLLWDKSWGHGSSAWNWKLPHGIYVPLARRCRVKKHGVALMGNKGFQEAMLLRCVILFEGPVVYGILKRAY